MILRLYRRLRDALTNRGCRTCWRVGRLVRCFECGLSNCPKCGGFFHCVDQETPA